MILKKITVEFGSSPVTELDLKLGMNIVVTRDLFTSSGDMTQFASRIEDVLCEAIAKWELERL